MPAQKKTRAKTGCLVCRARRIRCDEDRPRCRKCVKYMAECVYPEARPFDPVENREALQRRHQSTSDSHDPPVPADPLPAPPAPRLTDDQLLAHHAAYIHAICRATRMSSWFTSPTPPPDFLRVQFESQGYLEAVHHALTYTLSIIVVDEQNIPFVWLAPLFLLPSEEAPLGRSALRHAMMALGATHLASLRRRTPNQSHLAHSTLLSATRYQSTALNTLRRARTVPSELRDDRFLATTAILLCDAVLGAKPNWVEIHRLAITAIRARGGCAAILAQRGDDDEPGSGLPGAVVDGRRVSGGTLRAVVEQIAMTDIIAAMCTGGQTVLLRGRGEDGWWDDLDLRDPDSGNARQYESVDSNLGVHRGLILLQVRIINLISDKLHLNRTYGTGHVRHPSDLFPDPSHESTSFTSLESHAASLHSSLQQWHTRLPRMTLDAPARVRTIATWHACAILLHREIYEVPSTDEAVQDSVDCILEVCMEASGDKIEYLNLSLMVAGTNAITEEQRSTIRALIHSFEAQCGEELHVLLQVLEESWARADAGADDEARSWRQILLDIGRPVLIG